MQTRYETDNLILRILDETEYQMVLDFYKDGIEYFGAMEPDRPDEFFTEAYQKYALKCEYNLYLTDRSVRYYVFLKEEPDKVIGTVSLRDIKKDSFWCTTVGYKMLREYTGKGYCTQAVDCLSTAIMNENGIHRVQAYVQEDNYGSVKVLEKCGFEREGVVRDYVNLNGKWLDHALYSKIAKD